MRKVILHESRPARAPPAAPFSLGMGSIAQKRKPQRRRDAEQERQRASRSARINPSLCLCVSAVNLLPSACAPLAMGSIARFRGPAPWTNLNHEVTKGTKTMGSRGVSLWSRHLRVLGGFVVNPFLPLGMGSIAQKKETADTPRRREGMAARFAPSARSPFSVSLRLRGESSSFRPRSAGHGVHRSILPGGP